MMLFGAGFTSGHFSADALYTMPRFIFSTASLHHGARIFLFTQHDGAEVTGFCHALRKMSFKVAYNGFVDASAVPDVPRIQREMLIDITLISVSVGAPPIIARLFLLKVRAYCRLLACYYTPSMIDAAVI